MNLIVTDLTAPAHTPPVFSDLSFEVRAGSIVALRAPSGSGKSVLLRTLAWLLPPRSGTVTLGRQGPEQLGVPQWRAQVCYVAQSVPVLPGTPRAAWQNVQAFRVHKGRQLDDPVAQTERWGLACDRWHQPWSTLSGGEAQRIHLAMAMALRPPVLLLDEPTSALDQGTVALIERDLEGRTALWATHDAAQAARVASATLELCP